jgi:transposase
MSRQGIYNLVNRVNRKGLRGLKDQHIDRPGKLMVEIAEDLKRTLINSPTDQGYIERHWNNVLLRRYLNEKHGVDIGRAKLMNWISAIGIPVKLARKRYEKTAAAERSTLVTDLRKIQNHKLKEIIIYGNEAGAEVDVVLIAQWTPEVCPPDMFTGDRR